MWIQKDGSLLYFWSPNIATNYPNYASLAGRLYMIYGRNRNTWAQFNYYTAAGVNILGNGSAPNSLITQMLVTTQSGQTTTLSYGQSGSYWLLQSMTLPDGQIVRYYYDASGDLYEVVRPGNNGDGSTITELYSYWSGTSWMQAAYSPRWLASGGASGSYRYWANYTGNGTPQTMEAVGVVNFTPADGTNTLLQPSAATGAVGYYTAAYSFDSGATQMTDSDGHNTLFAFDANGRTVQQSVQVSSTLTLTSTQGWDAQNNLVSMVSAQGNETDAVYDASGNPVAIAGPQTSATTEMEGAIRPTMLLSYDAYNNVISACSARATYLLGLSWNATPPAATDSLCPSGTADARQYQYTYPSYEPSGELQGITTAGIGAPLAGYQWTYSYAPAQQNGSDYGLPTAVTGTSYTQADGTLRQPSAQMWYDAQGRLSCRNTGSGYWVYTYDAMGRLLTSSDPDDTSAGTGSCGKTGGQAGWNTTTTIQRSPDGTVYTMEGPSQRAGGVSNIYTFDPDGNPIQMFSWYGNISGVAVNTYDGADRLVETQLPSTSGETPWLTRYLYDLSQGAGNVASNTQLVAHGNVFDMQRYTTEGWLDVAMQSSDPLGRVTTSYSFAPCPFAGASGAIFCAQSPKATSYAYDNGGALGELTSMTDPLNEVTAYAYDVLGHVAAVQYSGDGGVTPATSYLYRADGAVKTITSSSLGVEAFSYDLEGNLFSKVDPPSLGSAITEYVPYPDGSVESVYVSSQTLATPTLLQYAYRADGLLQKQIVNYRGTQPFSYTYTAAGRLLQRTDVGPTPSIAATYDQYGQEASLQVPEGSYTGITHDDEGNVTGYQAYGGEQVGITYDVRGELTGESFTPNGFAADGYEAWPAFGYTPQGGTLIQDPTEAWDARTGAVIGIGGSAYGYDAGGRLVSAPQGQTFTYDAANRLLSGEADLAYVTQNCGGAGARTLRGLGGETRWTSSLEKYVYGPEGTVVQSISTAFEGGSNITTHHWGNGPLLYEDFNGALAGVHVGEDGTISGSSSDTTVLNVADRDPLGNMAASHNVTGYSAWTAPNPQHQQCVAANPMPASAGFSFATVATPLASYPSIALMDDGYNLAEEGTQLNPSALTTATAGGEPSPYLVQGNNPSGASLLDRRVADDCAQPQSTRRGPEMTTGAPCQQEPPPEDYSPGWGFGDAGSGGYPAPGCASSVSRRSAQYCNFRHPPAPNPQPNPPPKATVYTPTQCTPLGANFPGIFGLQANFGGFGKGMQFSVTVNGGNVYLTGGYTTATIPSAGVGPFGGVVVPSRGQTNAQVLSSYSGTFTVGTEGLEANVSANTSGYSVVVSPSADTPLTLAGGGSWTYGPITFLCK